MTKEFGKKNEKKYNAIGIPLNNISHVIRHGWADLLISYFYLKFYYSLIIIYIYI